MAIEQSARVGMDNIYLVERHYNRSLKYFFNCSYEYSLYHTEPKETIFDIVRGLFVYWTINWDVFSRSSLSDHFFQNFFVENFFFREFLVNKGNKIDFESLIIWQIMRGEFEKVFSGDLFNSMVFGWFDYFGYRLYGSGDF